MNKNESTVWKFGDNIDTDLIIAARYLSSSDPQHLKKFVMEDANEKFASMVQVGDVIVAGENFGCGSSREHAPIALKAAGIKAVIAKSFARIFYRNSFNMGLPIYEIKQTDEIDKYDKLIVDEKAGLIKNITKNKQYSFKTIPPFMQELVDNGGLMNLAVKEIKNCKVNC
ncbi:MAG: 3-isopropylmalate dehydratase [Campylobacteraceae bacterium 4484_166]|nr:MAG: 3-isopropylmalate dehydratase [Campylobacteraceae bacterium 4484_166]